MATRILGPTGSTRRRWSFLSCLFAALALGMLFIAGALGTPPQTNPPGYFELDKNAVNNQSTYHQGTLLSSIKNATALTFDICEKTPVLPGEKLLTTVDAGAKLRIDGEVMTLVSVDAPKQPPAGGCKFSDPNDTAADVATYHVTRGAGATSHPATSDVTREVTGTEATNPGTDWDVVQHDVQLNPPTDANPNPCQNSANGGTVIANAVACDWINRAVGGATGAAFTTGGSKDDLNINDCTPSPCTSTSTVTNNWQWANTSVPDADQINDGYAIKFVDPAAESDGKKHQFLYFGADRFATNGSKDFSFWFFQNPVRACGAAGAPQPPTCTAGTFVTDAGLPAEHRVNDILISGTFTQGGAVTTVRVFKWVGSGGDTNGTLNTGPVGPDCVPGGSQDLCNTVNNTTVSSPWAYVGKAAIPSNPQVFYTGAFMEGGIDLTAAGLQGCFSSFMATTRSAPSIGSQDKAFILGKFEACGSSVVTTPAAGADTSTTPPTYAALTDHNSNGIPDIQLSTAGRATVSDTAVLSVTGSDTFTGTLDFHLCGPLSNATSNCAGTGGAAINAAAGTNPVTASGTYHSADTTLTKAGRYCWRSNFTSGTLGVPNASDPPSATSTSLSECFEVLPRTPTLTTTATCSTACNSGSAVNDVAHLGNTAKEPGTGGLGSDGSINAAASTQKFAGGTITFKLYGPASTATCVDPPTTGANLVLTSVVTIVNSTTVGGDGDYNASDGVITGNGGTLNITAPGTYYWIASYSGDSPNTTGPVSTLCGDDGETSLIQKLQPTMDTAQRFVPNDSATVTVASGAGNLDGTVTFYMFVNSASCQGGDLTKADYTSAAIDVTVDGTPNPGTAGLSKTVSSGNTTAYSTTGTTFSWIVKYQSNNSGHFDVTSACTNETSSITINNGSQSNSS